MATAEIRYRPVSPRLWRDARFRRLDPQAQQLWLWLLTCGLDRSIPGLVPALPMEAAALLGITEKEALAAIDQLGGLGWVIWDVDAGLAWIPGRIDEDAPSSSKNVAGWAREWHELPACPLLEQARLYVAAWCERREEERQEAAKAAKKPAPGPGFAEAFAAACGPRGRGTTVNHGAPHAPSDAPCHAPPDPPNPNPNPIPNDAAAARAHAEQAAGQPAPDDPADPPAPGPPDDDPSADPLPVPLEQAQACQREWNAAAADLGLTTDPPPTAALLRADAVRASSRSEAALREPDWQRLVGVDPPLIGWLAKLYARDDWHHGVNSDGQQRRDPTSLRYALRGKVPRAVWKHDLDNANRLRAGMPLPATVSRAARAEGGKRPKSRLARRMEEVRRGRPTT